MILRNENYSTAHDLKLTHFFPKKTPKNVTIWEYLPKRYYFWPIVKQKRQKVWQFEVMDCI